MKPKFATQNTKYYIPYTGFTLVELLVVIAILGVLVTIGLVSFTSAQGRGRDSQRKSNLKQISTALELFYNDYGRYPNSTNGAIDACPYPAATVCTWGQSEFRDTDAATGITKTTYFKVLPKDPASTSTYFYRVPDPTTGQKFQIFAHLENTQDSALISTSYSCGTNNTCNFALTSPNTTPTE